MKLVSNTDDMTGLYDDAGGRKYVCASERQRFLAATDRAVAETRTFALVLAFCGCRISEALSITASQLDPETDRLILRTLKRRRQVFRAVPIPADLMRELVRLARGKPSDERLWGWCRQTAWRRIKRLMDEAGIRGAQATAKGLRHGFGIANAEANVPPALTQRWMGHARLETTAIYQHAVGQEERAFAQRIWRRSEKRRH
jgi:integrase